MKHKTITVILPQYNHRAYLFEAVQGIINQTYPHWELLIMNDEPGLDLTWYELLDNRIHVYHAGERKGQAIRLNEGIELAESDYIAIHDCDDVSIPQRFELSLKHIQGYDALIGDGIILFKDGIQKYVSSNEPSLETLKTDSFGCFGSTFIKTDLAKRTLFKPVKYGNDWIWWIRIMKQHPKVFRLPMPLYFIRYYTSNYRLNPTTKIQAVKARIHKKIRLLQLQKIVNRELEGL